jgi:hypothetical protein
MDNKLGNPSLDTDAIADRALYNCFIVIDFRLRDFLGGNGNGFALSFLRLCLMDRFRSMQIDGAGLAAGFCVIEGDGVFRHAVLGRVNRLLSKNVGDFGNGSIGLGKTLSNRRIRIEVQGPWLAANVQRSKPPLSHSS